MKNKSETKLKTTESKTSDGQPDQAALMAALEKLFTDEGYEIPDDFIVGPYKHKIDQLEARVNHLTQALVQLSARLNGEPAKAGRVDPVALADWPARKLAGEKK